MYHRSIAKVAAAIATFAVIGGAAAAYDQSPPQPTAQAPPPGDEAFAKAAAQANIAEITAARLALANSHRPDVKQFAERMIEDHIKANATLRKIAAAEGFKLPMEASRVEVDRSALLHDEKGELFDRSYIRDQQESHKEAVALFTRENQSGQDEALKAFSMRTLPVIEEHLRMITAMSATVKSVSAH